MAAPYPLTFQPAFKFRIWGGTELQRWFEDCPTDTSIGEAWVLSDHAEGTSPVANGAYAGLDLHDVMSREPEWFQSLPQTAKDANRFPLLFKVIDAADELSVQVHPDDEYGFAHRGEQGKTECWWVLRADEGSRIIYGHNAQSKEELRDWIERGEWDALLNSITPMANDFLFVPSGKIHALGKGIMVLEIQQSSDTTYRVFDYNRLDANGNPRALHLEDAIAVTTCPDSDVSSIRTPVPRPWPAEGLVACPFFRVEHWTLPQSVRFQPDTLQVLSFIQGEGNLVHHDMEIPFRPGTQILIPNGVASVELEAQTTSVELLVTTFPEETV